MWVASNLYKSAKQIIISIILIGGGVFMKKTLIIMLLFIILGGFSYVYIGKSNINHKLEAHLKDKGYKDSEIRSIEVNHSFMAVVLSYNEWNIRVVFNDEPNTIYHYNYKKGSISQGGISGFTKDNVYKHGDPEPVYK